MAIDLEQAALGFAAAGSEPRLEVLLALVRAGEDGLTVGAERLAGVRPGAPGRAEASDRTESPHTA